MKEEKVFSYNNLFKNQSISILFKLNFINAVQNKQLYRTTEQSKKLGHPLDSLSVDQFSDYY